MRILAVLRSQVPAPAQSDLALTSGLGIYINERWQAFDAERVALSETEWVFVWSDTDTRITFQCDGAGGCSFVPTHRQAAVSIDDWIVDGAGGCWFDATDNPTFQCDGVGGAWFIPTRQGPLQMDGVGGAQFGAVGLGVAGLQMDGAGTCLFSVASVPASVQGSFRCDGIGGMEIITTLNLGFISDDGTAPSGGNRRWNYAF